MKVLIAPDSFKDCLSAAAVADAIARGVHWAVPHAEVIRMPVADGGEGFVAALTASGRGDVFRTRVTGPLGDAVDAAWGILTAECVAVIEMAQAAGLEIVPPERRDPTRMTTHGVGELLRAARRAGAGQFVVGIGGSATNDGGLGMAQALGFEFLDERGECVPAPGKGAVLHLVRHIIAPPVPLLKEGVRVACDVDNPLLGPRGAARTYAAQKGATAEQIESLERGMENFAAVICGDLGIEVRDLEGGGAAGGLGAGLVAFCGATLHLGAALVLDALGFDRNLSGADLVITGEGAVNAQTLRGKAPWEVHRRARARGIPTLILAGNVSEAPPELVGTPLVTLRAIAPEGTSRGQSMRDAARLIEAATRHVLSGRIC